MSDLELQEEEREVLSSIYDGDPAFKQISPVIFQYKYGLDDDPKSFLLEISWGETYPSELPSINMDTFYNKHVVGSVKKNIISEVLKEAQLYLGAAMTYTLFEYVKEKAEVLVSQQPESFLPEIINSAEKITLTEETEQSFKKNVKKEQLTKAQKRKQWDRVDAKGDKPRGWDWVDVVKHLSQTGSKVDSEAPSPPIS